MAKPKQENLEVIADLWESYSNRKFTDKLVCCAVCRVESINVSAGFCSECVDEFADDYLEEAENS